MLFFFIQGRFHFLSSIFSYHAPYFNFFFLILSPLLLQQFTYSYSLTLHISYFISLFSLTFTQHTNIFTLHTLFTLSYIRTSIFYIISSCIILKVYTYSTFLFSNLRTCCNFLCFIHQSFRFSHFYPHITFVT